MKFYIQKSLDYILDQQNSLHLRAIELFALLVALHVGTSQVKVSDKKARRPQAASTLVFDVSKRQMLAARMLAAMKMLDQLERQWVAKNQGQKPTMEMMAKVQEYQEIFDNIILGNGSWYRIRFLQNIRDLEDELSEPCRQALNIARIIEFSCRYVPNPKKPKQLGGVTMAIDIVTSTKYFNVSVKDSTLEEWWKHQQSAAPFFYLIYVQKYPFYLNRIAGSHFAQRYLAKVGNRPNLLEFFFAYNSVVQQLGPRGYKYTSLQLPNVPVPRAVSFDPFRNGSRDEGKVLAAIDRYRK